MNAWETKRFSFRRKIASDVKLLSFRSCNNLKSARVFAVLQMNLACSGPSKSKKWDENLYLRRE